MEPEESLEEFLARLRTQILRCGYEPAQVNRELRDRCVLGSRGELQRKLLRSFTGQPVPVHGEATVQTEHDGQRKRLNVVVSGQLRHHPLLGRDWLREIRLDWRSLLQVSEASKVMS
ncbi:hypothetical protein FJT64_011756 [Amphibalanus amphitrite]|uniref:Uncharacterized protein n=1 Tax=Amphibalanus amphitrite TaxID=1232801 RepID=A0A6A4VA92_AMPAM|nr:hypothetical protein FJT64_011756 [Amphibalanus amphitrite]